MAPCPGRITPTTSGTTASEIEEWEFQSNGELDLFVLNVRYQSIGGPDVDTVYHVRGYMEDMSPDTLTYVGQGDLDSTSGAGNDIRFDFASLGNSQRRRRRRCLPRFNRPPTHSLRLNSNCPTDSGLSKHFEDVCKQCFGVTLALFHQSLHNQFRC